VQLGAQLLASTSHSIAQIAAEVGYESEPAFSGRASNGRITEFFRKLYPDGFPGEIVVADAASETSLH
jgi:AraC-like DNA-binding protein